MMAISLTGAASVRRAGETIRRIRRRLARGFRPQLRSAAAYVSHFSDKEGLEIGGPSGIFRDKELIPLYRSARRVDGVNFSTNTVWHAEQQPGRTYDYLPGHEKGIQFILEGTDLSSIASERYDFVLSSHSLEHFANPIRALKEWMRVLKKDGLLLLVLPHKERTFDHRRPITSLAHVMADYEHNVSEDDLTHLPEILQNHDLAMDPPAGDLGTFRKRSLQNRVNRCLHHHVFDTRAALMLVDHVGLQIVRADTAFPHHIVVLARKAIEPDNRGFFSPHAEVYARSVFKTDRDNR